MVSVLRRAMPGLVVACVLFPGSARAQEPGQWDPRDAYVTRAELRNLVGRLEATLESPAYSRRLHARARRELDLVQSRLAAGDFRPGDRIRLVVQGETTLTDTFTVREGPMLNLRDVAEIPLRGVLRAELDSQVTTHLARVVRRPQVRSQALVRVQIAGAVARPGVYTIPSSTLLTDALGVAGGMASNARLDAIEVKRDGQTIWDDSSLGNVVARGPTLDQLGLRDGDLIDVGQASTTGSLGWLGSANASLRSVSLLLALPFSVLALTRLF